jgi:aldehyde oxidoreductase
MIFNSLAGSRPGSGSRRADHRHETLRPLGIKPTQINLVMNDTLQPELRSFRRQPLQRVHRQRNQGRLRMLLNAMKKPDGTYRTYDEMVAEKIPLRYDGKWVAVCLHGVQQ